MKNRMTRLLFCAVAGVLMMGGLAAAQGPSGPPAKSSFIQHRSPFEQALGLHGEWWNNPRMIERLKLTDEQRKAMDDILQAHREKLIDLHASLEKAEIQMKPLMGADQPNEKAILAQIDKIAAARAELEKANARFLLAQRAKLTPEQWKIVQDMRMHHDQPHHAAIHRQQWIQRDGPGAPPPPQPAPAAAPQPPVQ